MCGTAEPETGGQRLVVDHFQSGQAHIRVIRGMVCDACNSAMSCLDGNKRWGPRRGVLEPQARAYQAQVLRDLPLAELAAIERIQEQRQMRIARPPQQKSSKEKTDGQQPGGRRGDERMSEPMIHRRSLPDSLRYLAEKLDGPLSDAERAGVALTLNSLADEADAFAHELAEQQRGHIQKQCVNDSDGDGDCAACARNPEALCRQPTLEGRAVARVADLIDPYASAGPVRPDEETT